MQIISCGDNLYKMSELIIWENTQKNINKVSSAELAQRVLKFDNTSIYRVINFAIQLSINFYAPQLRSWREGAYCF